MQGRYHVQQSAMAPVSERLAQAVCRLDRRPHARKYETGCGFHQYPTAPDGSQAEKGAATQFYAGIDNAYEKDSIATVCRPACATETLPFLFAPAGPLFVPIDSSLEKLILLNHPRNKPWRRFAARIKIDLQFTR